MINHNFKPRVDPKDPTSSALNNSNLNNSGISGGSLNNSGIHDSKMDVRKMDPFEARKWIYEEFKPQKKQKLSLSAMDDRAKEEYLKNQVDGIGKLREQKKTLKEHLESLEDKLDETLFKMKEKKKNQDVRSPEELERKKALDEKFKEMKGLKEQATKLKEQFTSGGGFDKLKELENKKKEKEKSIKELQKQKDNLALLNAENKAACEGIQSSNETEVREG